MVSFRVDIRAHGRKIASLALLGYILVVVGSLALAGSFMIFVLLR